MPADLNASVIVVGAGPCAAIAARELVVAGLDVTMLDAGRGRPRGIVAHAAGRTVLRWTQDGFLFTDRQHSVGHQPVTWISSLSLGGLTNFWTGAVPRFAPDDFTEGGAIDDRFIWPIRYEDLVEYYEVVERDLAITGGETKIANVPPGLLAHRFQPPDDWVDVAQRSAAHGEMIAPMPIARGSPWMVALRPREFDSYHCIVRRLVKSTRFRLRSGAHVVRLNAVSSASPQVQSATFVDSETRELRTIRGRAFVLAAGPLDTTEILLRSVSTDFPDGLGNSHGVLGRYLHDHPREWWPARPRRPLTALVHPMYIGRQSYDSDSPLHAASFMIGIGSSRARLATFVNRRITDFGVQVLGTMVPSDRVSVSLANGWQADTPESQLHLDHRFEDDAISNMERARTRFRRIFADAGNPVDIDPTDDLVPGSAVHYGGTARMHARPEFGVVDAVNRLHAAPNVLVCDASCFTTGPEKNPTLTAMAIAARAARRLAADLT